MSCFDKLVNASNAHVNWFVERSETNPVERIVRIFEVIMRDNSSNEGWLICPFCKNDLYYDKKRNKRHVCGNCGDLVFDKDKKQFSLSNE